jgi:glycosyltransferase involved in cell wall biosynthesis
MKSKTFFFLQSGCGGAERMTIYIASCLDAAQYDISFYIIGKDRGKIEQFIPSAMKIEFIQVDSFRDYLIFKLFNIIKNEKPDIVFSSVFPINYRLCLAASLFPSCKVILRNDNYLYTQTFTQKARIFLAYRFTDHVIAQTDEMGDELVNQLLLKPNSVTVCSNPINKVTIDEKVTDSASPFEEGLTNYVFVGRIAAQKGVDTLIEAFKIVVAKDEKVRLFIVGDIADTYENYYQYLIEIIREENLKSYITFVGFSNNPYIYMKYASCFVLASRNEGLPNVLIEALYLGTPIAATTCIPVIERIVQRGINGYLVDVDDSNALAIAMERASKLGRVKSTYKSASPADFKAIFNLHKLLL